MFFRAQQGAPSGAKQKVGQFNFRQLNKRNGFTQQNCNNSNRDRNADESRATKQPSDDKFPRVANGIRAWHAFARECDRA